MKSIRDYCEGVKENSLGFYDKFERVPEVSFALIRSSYWGQAILVNPD